MLLVLHTDTLGSGRQPGPTFTFTQQTRVVWAAAVRRAGVAGTIVQHSVQNVDRMTVLALQAGK